MKDAPNTEQEAEGESMPFDEALRRILSAPPQHKKAEDKPPPGKKDHESEK